METLNPEINLDSIPARIPIETIPWPTSLSSSSRRRRVAGVSSFGISGTDGHVILEEPPQTPNPLPHCVTQNSRPLHILKLSAKCAESLELMVTQYEQYLELSGSNTKFEDICYSANGGRATFSHRAVVLAKDSQQALEILRARSFPTADVQQGTARICFLFTGQGSQYPGMASELYATSPLFRLHFDKVAGILEQKYNISIKEVMWGDSGDEGANLTNTLYSQTSIFCVEYALLKLWEEWGVKPDCVLGHSLGEFAAAVTAGILEPEDALHLVALRSGLIHSLPPGKMLVIKGDKEEVDGMIAGFRSRRNPTFWADTAALNSPDQTVLAGDSEMIEAFGGFCSENGLKSIVLGSSHAFHSRHMDPILEAYGKAAAATVHQLSPASGNSSSTKIKFISGVEGRVVDAKDVGVDYWIRHTREKVNFLDACKTVESEGCTLLLEIGPHPVLSALALRNLEGTTTPLTVLPSLRRNAQDLAGLLDSLGKLFLSDWKGSISWRGVDSGYHPRARVPLPLYPFHRKPVWLDVRPEHRLLHPLLGRKLPTAVPAHFVYEQMLLLKNLPYVRDHVIGNTVIFPGAGFLEASLAAGVASAMGLTKGELLTRPRRPIGLRDLKILSPMGVPESAELLLQTVANFQGSEIEIRICRQEEVDKWVAHATSRFLPSVSSSPSNLPDQLDISSIISAGDSWDPRAFYQKTSVAGYKFGPAFQSLEAGWRADAGGSRMLFKVKAGLPREDNNEYNDLSYLIHPVTADAMLHAAMICGKAADHVWKLEVPLLIGEFDWLRGSSVDNTRESCYIHCGSSVEDGKVWVTLVDAQGSPMASMRSVEFVETNVKLLEGLVVAQANELPKIWEEVYSGSSSSGVPPGGRTNSLDLTHSRFEFSEELKAELEKYNNSRTEEKKIYRDLCEIGRICFLKALYQLGWSPEVGDVFSAEGLLSTLRIPWRYTNYVNFFLGNLAEVGMLEVAGSCVGRLENHSTPGFRFAGGEPPSKTELELRLNSFGNLQQLPDNALVALEFGENLAGILAGHDDPLSLLFPEDRSKPGAALYYNFFPRIHTFPLTRIMESVVLPVLREQTGRPFRILEVGAGTGSFSGIMLHILRESGIPFEYHYTDVSAAYFPQAEKDFGGGGGADNIVFKRLDMEEDPLEQGYSPETFDMLYAGEVLHVAKDIKKTLRRLRLLLKPGGLFQIVETIVPCPRTTFVFGLLPGYWQFQDFNFRRHHTTLTGPMWEEALASADFKSVTVSPDYMGVHGVILAVADDGSRLATGSSLSDDTTTPKRAWVVFGGVDDQLERGLGESLARLSRTATIFKRGPGKLEAADDGEVGFKSQVSGLFDSIRERGLVLEGVLYLWGLPAAAAGEESHPDQSRVSLPLLSICQALSQLGVAHPPQILVVTQGVHMVHDSVVGSPSGGTLSGMIRSIVGENKSLKVSQLDLCPEASPTSQLRHVMATLWSEPPPILACRDGTVHEPKLLGWKPPNWEYLPLPVGCTRFRLVLPKTRLISDLEFTYLDEPRPLAEGDVEVEVKAVALNFRDVLTVLKPIAAFEKFHAVGLDLAGVVTRLGPNVKDRSVGDRVMWMNSSAGEPLSSHRAVRAPATLVLPDSMTFAEGATIPVVFCTASYCLRTKARLRGGETVLVHTASGGVGLAAIQIATQVGAVVFATAGNRRKRHYLRNVLGLEHVFDSRSLEFGKQVLAATGGRGVDVVLNSLTGPGFKEESLAALARNGRFVEMSKLNVWSVEEVRERRPDAAYHLVDLTELEESDHVELNAELERLLKQGLIQPLPHVRFDALNIRGALNYLQQAKHIGKVVCVMPELREQRLAGNGANDELFYKKTPLFNEHSTYLVTGGLRGIGFEMVKWILGSGGKHVVVASRSSPRSEVREQLRSWNKAGKNVQAFAVDVGNHEECRHLLERIGTVGFPPIRGLMHAAGVLADGVLENQSWSKFGETYKAKVEGSWNLHQLTKGLPLEHFVLFSSMSASFGSPGQANHCGANSFMDTLANYRTSLGLPATSINWGNWGEVGVATEVDFPGVSPIRTAQGILALEVFLRTQTRRAVVANIESFPMLATVFPNARELFDDKLFLQGTPQSRTWNTEDFWVEVDGASAWEAKLVVVKNMVKMTIQNILRLEASEVIEDDADFTSLGVDSLMMLELKNGLQAVLGSRLTISAADLKHGSTASELATRLLKLLERPSWRTAEEGMPTLEELKQLIREDSVLPDNITPVDTFPPKRIDQVGTILLTGVTGNLGPYLLRELSHRESISKIICLIRTKGKASPMERLTSTLEKFNLTEEVNMGKVKGLLGDISEPMFGLSEWEYKVLAESVEAVVHSAVLVDHNAKYWKAPIPTNKCNIRTVNVEGTLHVLKFCTEIRSKHLFHASTIAAVARADKAGGFSEDWQDVGAFDEISFNWGYPLTKHVAEQLVRQAAERGLPCKAFRFPVIGGDSRDGRCDHQTSYTMLRWLTVLKVGAISDASAPLPYIPVDQAASQSLSVFFNPEAGSDVYSLNQVNPDREEVLVEVAKEEFGIDVQILSSDKFLKMIEAEDDSSPIAPFRRLYTENQFCRNAQQAIKWLPAYHAAPNNFFSCKKMTRYLADFEESLPSTHACLRRDLHYLRDAGVFTKFGIQSSQVHERVLTQGVRGSKMDGTGLVSDLIN